MPRTRVRKPRNLRIGDVVEHDGVYRIKSGDYIEPLRKTRSPRRGRSTRKARRTRSR